MKFPKVSTEIVPDVDGKHPRVFDEILAPVMPLGMRIK